MIFAANSPAVTEPGPSSVFRIGDDLPVNRLGFGAMRITGEGIWGGRLTAATSSKFCDVSSS
jgi:hypothetical protein